MRRFLQMAVTLVLLIPLTVVAEQIGPLKNPQSFINRHQSRLLGISISLAVLGFVLLMGAILYAGLQQGRSTSPLEVQDAARSRRRMSWYRFRGRAVGFQYDEERSFREVKDALVSGQWRRDPQWRRFLTAVAGGVLMVFGVFGIPLAIGPPVVKLLCMGALIYATVRTVWAFLQA